MIEEYVKIICDRCGKDTLVKKNGFPDNVASYYVHDDRKWSLKDKGAISDLCPQCRREYEEMLHKFFCEGLKHNDE